MAYSTNANPAAMVSFGVTTDPAPAWAGEEAPAELEVVELVELEDELLSAVTMVVACGGIVVPGIVVAATVETGVAVAPLVKLCVTVCAAIVVAGFVVPGIVVVYVTSCPSELDGIAPPTPDPVNCVGTDRVAVLGLEARAEV